MTFSDQQLKAYLAGDLLPAEADELELQLAHDYVLEARLLSFDRLQSAPIQAAFENAPSLSRLDALTTLISTAPLLADDKLERAESAIREVGLPWRKMIPIAAVVAFAAFMLGGFVAPSDLSLIHI